MAAVAEVAAVAASLHLPLQTAESATARRRKRTTTTAGRMGKTRLLSLPVEQLRVSAVMMTEAGVSSLGVDHHHREARRLEEAGLMASSHGRAKKERVKWTSVHASAGGGGGGDAAGCASSGCCSSAVEGSAVGLRWGTLFAGA